MLHQKAFVNPQPLLGSLHKLLGAEFRYALGRNSQLPLAAVVKAYPFNSQLLTVPDGSMVMVAPKESKSSKPARAFLERVKAQDNPVKEIDYLDVRQSMQNGGGPACLRQRIWLSNEEKNAILANVFFTPELHQTLDQWALRHYPDRLSPRDLGSPTPTHASNACRDAPT